LKMNKKIAVGFALGLILIIGTIYFTTPRPIEIREIWLEKNVEIYNWDVGGLLTHTTTYIISGISNEKFDDAFGDIVTQNIPINQTYSKSRYVKKTEFWILTHQEPTIIEHTHAPRIIFGNMTYVYFDDLGSYDLEIS